MTIHRLSNETWGLETNCFVCEPTNDNGLRIPFVHDDECDLVTAEFELSDAFSGAPTLVHGGVTLAVLDEAMAWACIAIAQQWAVTTETSTRFQRAVEVGRRYRVEATVVEQVDGMLHTEGRIFDRRDRLHADARASFTALGEAQAERLAGAPLDDRHRRFVAE